MYREHFCNKTFFGGLLSILIFLIISILFINFFLIFALRKKYTIYDSETKLGKATRYWKPEDFSIIILDKYFNQIEESERYFEIDAEIWTDKRITLDNGTVISETVIVPIELTKCNILNYSNFDLWRDEKLINDSTCFSNSIIKQKANSTGNFGGTGYTGIVIWIHLCNNDTTKNKTYCYSKEKSKEKLENIFIYVKFFDYYFEHDSYDNISTPYIYSELIQASSSSYKRIWYQFQKILYKTDKGILFDDIDTKDFVTLSSSYNSIDLRTESTVKDSFSAVSLNMEDNTKIIEKEYYKFQELCADLGGIINFIFFVAKVLNYFFTINIYYHNIINKNINNFLPKSAIKRISINRNSNNNNINNNNKIDEINSNLKINQKQNNNNNSNNYSNISHYKPVKNNLNSVNDNFNNNNNDNNNNNNDYPNTIKRDKYKERSAKLDNYLPGSQKLPLFNDIYKSDNNNNSKNINNNGINKLSSPNICLKLESHIMKEKKKIFNLNKKNEENDNSSLNFQININKNNNNKSQNKLNFNNYYDSNIINNNNINSNKIKNDSLNIKNNENLSKNIEAKIDEKKKLSCKIIINPFIALCPRLYFGKNNKIESNFAKYELMLYKNIDICNFVNNMNLIEKIAICLLGSDNIHKLNNCFNPLNELNIKQKKKNSIDENFNNFSYYYNNVEYNQILFFKECKNLKSIMKYYFLQEN